MKSIYPYINTCFRALELIKPSFPLSLGFTFIELLIVISLLIFLSVVGIASFANYASAQTFKSGVEDVFTLLQQAKSKTLSQVKSATCNSQGVLYGYRVSICSMAGSNCLAGNDFELVARCGGATESAANSYDRIGKKLPRGVSFDVTVPAPKTDSAWFLFTVLRGGVINSNLSNSGIIIIQDTNGRSQQITVNSQGNIIVN